MPSIIPLDFPTARINSRQPRQETASHSPTANCSEIGPAALRRLQMNQERARNIIIAGIQCPAPRARNDRVVDSISHRQAVRIQNPKLYVEVGCRRRTVVGDVRI